MTPSADGLVTRQPGRLAADPSRVCSQLFVPGHALPGGRDARASGVVEHILGLTDVEVTAELAAIATTFDHRHRDLLGTFHHHADRISNRLPPGMRLSDERWALLGAAFTCESAVEAAALCNPSMVAAPDQAGVPAGALRFVMSVRQIGEGHRSSIGFRTGLVDHAGTVTVEPTGPFTTIGTIEAPTLDRAAFRTQAEAAHEDAEATGWVLDRLSETFSVDELEVRLGELDAQRDTRRNASRTVRSLRHLASRSYLATFPGPSALSERVLYPATATESNGMEDARWVRYVDEDGRATYLATYTAYDGVGIALQLLTTDDFETFAVSPLLGDGAANKGLALFPRRIGGRYVALSRQDGAANAIATSDDLRRWPKAAPFAAPRSTWEAVQVGNCGSPIETDEGWLVITHGVGPMRRYSLGAWLLDLDDPSKVIGRLTQPLLTPTADEQDGYVPNVVYSCGSLVHAGLLVLPYGIGDAAIAFATAPLDGLLDLLLHHGP